MKKYIISFIVCYILSSQYGYSQYDRKWAVTVIASTLRFEDTTYCEQSSPFLRYLYTAGSLSSIYDPNTNTLIATNAVSIVTDQYDTLAKGDDLVDEIFRKEYPSGTPGDASVLLLPKKGAEFYSINISSSGAYDSVGHEFFLDRNYYSVFDATKGMVSSKNLLDSIQKSTSFMAATRHANGRDFWIIQKAFTGNTYFIFRTSPDTIVLDHIQTIGDSSGFGDAWGTANFSADGSKFGVSCATQHTQIFDFDRCTGYLSNRFQLKVPWYEADGRRIGYTSNGLIVGQICIAFSASGRYAYVNSYYRIYQYDLAAGDSLAIMNSEYLVAQYDTTYFTNWNSYRPFGFSRIAPDKRIYWGTWEARPNNYTYIRYPDSAGVACGFSLFGMPLNSYGNHPLPNVPHYALGAKIGSGCDTAFTTGVATLEKLPWSMYPNPTATTLTIDLSGAATISILDLMGRAVLQQDIQDKTTLSLGHLSAGVYEVQLQQGARRGVKKLILMR